MNGKRICGNLTVFILFGFYPLFMTNGYFNITKTKYIVFCIVTLLMFLYLALYEFHGWCSSETVNPGNLINKMTLTDKLVIGFILAQFIAFFVSADKFVSFTGSSNKYMGLYTFILLGILYLIIRRAEINYVVLTVTAGIADCIVVIFGIVQFCGVDVLGIFENVEENMKINYISTMGNTGVFGVYLIFMTAWAIGIFCTTQIQEIRIVSGTTVFLNYMGILIANTDATFLGFGVVMVVCGIIYGTNKKSGIQFLECMLAMAASGIVLRTVFLLVPHRPISRFGQMALSFPFTAFFLLISTILFFLWGKWGINDRTLKIIKKIIMLLTISGIAAVLSLIFYFSVLNTETDLGTLENYFRINDDWGSGRGYVWRRMLKIYVSEPTIHKLFGSGQGMVLVQMIQNYKMEMGQTLEYLYDDAHNIYIQYLCTSGLFGVGTYIAMIVNAIISGMKEKEESYAKIAAVALTACAVTDTVSILQPITIPFLWVFIALTQKNISEKNIE